MLLVVNKEKLKSYIVSIATVVILFVMASTIVPNRNTVETGANIQNVISENNMEENESNTNTQNNKYEAIEKTE